MDADEAEPTTYTVFNIEMEGAETDEHVSGLAAAQAARVLLERCTGRTEFRQIEGQCALVLENVGREFVTIAYAAIATDEFSARTEIYDALAAGACMLPGPYVSMTDLAYQRGRLASLPCASPEGAALLERKAFIFWHTITDPDDHTLAESLVDAGVLQRLRQRRGMPYLYRLADEP